MTPAPPWLLDRPFAHRGLHDIGRGRPENSRAAFRAAIERGYGIELDLQVSGDGIAMVFHDEGLERLAGESGLVRETTAERLGRCRLLGTEETIPTLAEVLDLVAGCTPLMLELKSETGDVGPLESATWKVLRRYHGPYVVKSFNPYSMGWFASHAPRVPRGQVATRAEDRNGATAHDIALERLQYRHVSRPCFISYNVHDLPYWAPLRARRQGLPLLVWTVRSEADRRIAATYADNIVFEGFHP